MALTPMRWAVGAIAGCLAMAVLVLRSDAPRERTPDEAWEVRKVLDRHGAHASSVARRLRLLSLLDSLGVARAAGGGEGTGSIRIVRDPALPAALADSMTALAQRAARQVPDSAGTGTDVVFIYDTLSQLHGAAIRRMATQVDYVLPRSTSERCVAVVHVGADATSKRQLNALPTDAAAQRLLGPCAYYQAFGLPGRQVDEWLRTRGWAFAGDGSWAQAAPRAELVPRDIWAGPWSVERAVVAQTTLPFLYDMRLDGTQCAAGERDACTRTLLERQNYRMPAMFNGNILFNSFTALNADPSWYPRRAFGRRETSLLADMVRTMGREHFASFWRSSEPVPVAFERAAGQPIAQWATRWAVGTYGTVAPRGPSVGIATALVSIAVMALTLLVGVVVSERRQFA
jgi:hypothetical protein